MNEVLECICGGEVNIRWVTSQTGSMYCCVCEDCLISTPVLINKENVINIWEEIQRIYSNYV